MVHEEVFEDEVTEEVMVQDEAHQTSTLSETFTSQETVSSAKVFPINMVRVLGIYLSIEVVKTITSTSSTSLEVQDEVFQEEVLVLLRKLPSSSMIRLRVLVTIQQLEDLPECRTKLFNHMSSLPSEEFTAPTTTSSPHNEFNCLASLNYYVKLAVLIQVLVTEFVTSDCCSIFDVSQEEKLVMKVCECDQ
jgi:hypothetical protein